MASRIFSGVCAVLMLSAAALASQTGSQITGDYVETRSADVYTGVCFANGEVNLVGDEAILAWHVTRGTWLGESLEGLNVVAAVKASATLGDPYAKPLPAKSVLIVDSRASAAQRQALIEFARHMAGALLGHTEKVVSAPIDMQVLHHAAGHDHGRAFVHAGQFATVETRGISDKDHFCGNEETYYPPLSASRDPMPAVALSDEFHGSGLGVDWERHDKRSAFVATFAENSGF
ncbi:MAG: DUF1326 domain-containing protein [Acidobacteria bacterium]|nr:DUF1326 domain-containing protein [Acidobacteriota bacterium]